MKCAITGVCMVVLEISRNLAMDTLDLEMVINDGEKCCKFEAQE